MKLLDSPNINRNLKILVGFMTLVVVGLILAIIFVPAPKRSEAPSPGIPPSDWVTYRSAKYGFEIKHPADWTVAVHEGAEPKINIYKKAEAAKPPFIHHNNVTQVSVFPKGIGTEGVEGETATSTIKFLEPTARSTDFLLADGSRWATFTAFKTPPASWEGFGFVWASVQVDESSTECMLNNEYLPMEKCDLGIERSPDAKIVRSGKINADDRRIEERMLESLIFWQASVRGEIVCLPHKSNVPQTQECAVGLRSDEGRHYGLIGLAQEDIVSGKWTTGVRALVSGTLAVAPESKYDIVGSISIEKIEADA